MNFCRNPFPSVARNWLRGYRVTLLLFTVPILLGVASPLHAGPIPSASYTAFTEASSTINLPGSYESQFYRGPVPGSVSLDAPFHRFVPDSPPDDGVDMEMRFDAERVARAEVFGGGRPLAVASAEVRVSSRNFNAFAESRASASVEYFVHVLPANDTGLVWRPTTIPVQVRARGEVTGPAAASASVNAIASTSFLFVDSASGFSGSTRTSFDRAATFDVAPDTLLRVILSANTHVSVSSTGGPQSISGRALADPTFEFDQAAFDRQALALGQPMFALRDFYAFVYSPTIEGDTSATSVPAPVAPLSLASLLLIARCGCWRHRLTPGASLGNSLARQAR